MKKTALVFALFNSDSYRIEMLKTVLEQLKQQTVSPYCAIGLLNSKALYDPRLKADQTVSLSGNPNLFQKEAIYNAIEKKLPSEIENLVFLDADIFTIDTQWLEKIETSLKTVPFAQAYSLLFYLTAKTTQRVLKAAAENAAENTEEKWRHENLIDANTLQLTDLQHHTADTAVAIPSFAYARGIGANGAAGGCYAFRRDFFRTIGGFPYEEVFGGLNDVLLLRKLGLHKAELEDFFPESVLSLYPTKEEKFKIPFVSSRMYHLFHKAGKNRQYRARVNLAKTLKYNPKKDIQLNFSGGIELTLLGRRLENTFEKIRSTHLEVDSI